VRRGELKGAIRRLCLTHVSVIRVGLPDGRVAQYANRVRNALLPLMSPFGTLVAPYERDGHPDHDTIGDICCRLARSHGGALARFGRRGGATRKLHLAGHLTCLEFDAETAGKILPASGNIGRYQSLKFCEVTKESIPADYTLYQSAQIRPLILPQ
jgi:LmbE family N-acetylglucosaminyl deacetylase